jgi:hypothetical protein
MASAVFSSATAFFQHAGLFRMLAVAMLFCIIAIVVCSVGQIKYINDATTRFEALLVQPIYQATWTLLSVAGGMVVQREWALFADSWRAFLFFLGIAFTVSGALLLSQVRSASAGEKAGGGKDMTPGSVSWEGANSSLHGGVHDFHAPSEEDDSTAVDRRLFQEAVGTEQDSLLGDE